MPYNFGDWSQIGSDIGAKIMGRPSARQAKDADRALAIKMAQDKESYEREQDRIKNFQSYGGFRPEQVMAGGEEAAFMGSEAEESFKANMAVPGNLVMKREFKAPSQNLKAYLSFQERMGQKYEGKLSFEQRQALLDLERKGKIELKETSPGAKKYDFGGKVDEPLEEPDAAPFKWSSPRTWGKQTKEDVAGWDKDKGSMIKVRLKSSGKTGSIAADKFDASLYEKI